MTSSPTITGTRPTATATVLPGIPFLFAAGDNQWQCAFNLSNSLFFTAGSRSFHDLALSDPFIERTHYQVVYVAPGLGPADYTSLKQMVAPGGFLEQFVALGGVAVINAGSTLGDQDVVAPDGVGFSASAQHNSETIQVTNHPYITGLGFAGEQLTGSDFAAWQPTDFGTLTNVPSAATILLVNGDGPSWAEYVHGAGRVIVTSLSYCTDGEPKSQEAAARNLLRYSHFFRGSALTPAPTVTQTGTPTMTLTRTVTRTPTPTASRSPTRTRTPTPVPGDVDGNGGIDTHDLTALVHAIFSGTYSSQADVNGDGAVSGADIPALIELLQ